MKPRIWWVLACLAGCGVVEADDDGPRTIDADVVDVVSIDAAPLTGRDCKEIHAAHGEAPSGTYTIDPDAEGADEPFEVHCDMTTRGGGWTLVLVPENTENAVAAMSYTSASRALLDGATHTLVVFRRADLEPLEHDVIFELPPAWRASSPFEALEESVDHVTMVSQDGGELIQEKVRYGRALFGTFCEDEWVAGQTFGRFCITRTLGTFYSGWANNGTSDFCSPSGSAFDTTPCTDERRFTIAVR